MSTELRENIGEGLISGFKGLGTYAIIIVAVVIVAGIGYAVYRRRTKWDELG